MNNKKNIFLEMETKRKKEYVKPKNNSLFLYPIVILTFIGIIPILLIIGILFIVFEDLSNIDIELLVQSLPIFKLIFKKEVLIFLGIEFTLLIGFIIIYFLYGNNMESATKAKDKLEKELNEKFFKSEIAEKTKLKYLFDYNNEALRKNEKELLELKVPFKNINCDYKQKNFLLGNYKNVNFMVANFKSGINLKTRFSLVLDSTDNSVAVLPFLIIGAFFQNLFTKKISGRLYVYKFPFNVNGDIRICGKFGNKGFYNFLNKYKKIKSEMIEFNNNFRIYATDINLFYKIINAKVIEKLERLKKIHKGKIYVSLQNDKLYILINNKSDILYLSLNKKIEQEKVEKTFNSDMNLIYELIDNFELSMLNYKI